MPENSQNSSFNDAVWYRKYWIFLFIFLLVMAVTAGILIFTRHPFYSQEIIISEPEKSQNQKIAISISGQVAHPGIYLVDSNNTLDDIVEMAGGNPSADYSDISIRLSPSENTSGKSQKIDINTAGDWLLDALPGIGSEKARTIIEYREQNGPFKYIEEMKNVPGIGESVFKGFQDLITVG